MDDFFVTKHHGSPLDPFEAKLPDVSHDRWMCEFFGEQVGK